MMLGAAGLLVLLLASAGVVPAAGLTVSRAGLWGPADLGAVEEAFTRVLANPLLTPAQRNSTQRAAGEVHEELARVQAPNITRGARQAIIEDVMAKLNSLHAELQSALPGGNSSSRGAALESKEETLKKELSEKKALLAKEKQLLKLTTMEEELMKKKLELAKLMEMKDKAEASKKSGAAVAEQQKETDMVKQLILSMAPPSAAPRANATAAAPILAFLRARARNVTETLQKIDAAERRTMGELDASMGKSVPTLGKGDALAKGKAMLRTLKKQEHHSYQKARAEGKTELAELTAAVRGAEGGDVKAVQDVYKKMQSELKLATAKSGSFVY